MNKRGQTVQLFFTILMVILVGTALFIASAQNVGTSTSTVTLGGENSNQTISPASLPAVGSSIDLVGQDLLSTPVVVNSSGGETVASGNYTLSTRVSPTTGVKTVYFQLDDPQYESANLTASGSVGLNMTYVYGVDGYINDSGGRAVASLILIFFALAIAVVTLSPVLRSGVMDLINR